LICNSRAGATHLPGVQCALLGIRLHRARHRPS
jgi:hypothetical protein